MTDQAPQLGEAPIDLTALWRGRRVLLTGSTGFVGKVALVMLLERYPEVGRVYALVRPGLSGTAEERFFSKVVPSPAFDPLRARHGEGLEAWLRERVVPVAGDLTDPHLGLDEATLEALTGQVDVLINSAGNVDFTPPLDASLKVNAEGPLFAAELAARLGAGLVHVSTCFTAGEREGHIFEEGPTVGDYPRAAELGAPFDPEGELRDCQRAVAELRARADDGAVQAQLRVTARARLSAEGRDPDDPRQLRLAMARERKVWLGRQLVEVGMSRSRGWGWQNTYCYTKALGDQRLAAFAARTPGFQYTVVKPAVVESALSFPFPGWNEGFTTAAPLMLMGLKGHRTFPVGEGVVLDVIPVDMVCAGILVAAALTCVGAQERCYQLASGAANPLTMERVVELTALARRRHRQTQGEDHWWDRLLTLVEPVARDRATFERVSVPMVQRASEGLRGWVDRLEPRWGAPRLRRAAEKARGLLDQVDASQADRALLFELFMPFIYDARYLYRADRMQALMRRLSPEDRARVPFAPEEIDWRRYWIDVHTEGLKRWVFPNLEGELAARRVRRNRPAADLVELLARSARRHPLAGALRQRKGGQALTLSYSELWARVEALAGRLAGHHQLAAGDRVLLAAESGPAWPIAFFAILRAGAVVVPVDGASDLGELRAIYEASGARLALLGEAPLEGANGSLEGLEVEALEAFAAHPGATPAPARPLKATDLAAIIYTSGTTGRPKGVMLSHANFTSLVARLGEIFPLGPGDGVLSVLPLHHTFELSCGLLTPLSQGAEITYLEALSPAALAEALDGGRVTAMVGVPALWQLLHKRLEGALEAQSPWVAELARALMRLNRQAEEATGLPTGRLLFAPVHRRLGGLRFLISGGAALSPQVLEDFRGLGLGLVEGYGLTESAPVLTVNRPGAALRPGSVGEALPGVELRIEAPDAEGVGEVWARGPNVMQGYFQDPEATAEAIEGGWLRTGDLGRVDEAGHLYLMGRAKEVIVDAGGKNIYPDEVEEAYREAPGLAEISVVGFTRPEGGEVVAALAVPDLEAGPLAGLEPAVAQAQLREALLEWGGRLPLYRRIKVLHLQDAPLPRTATRKVRRPWVKAQIVALEAARQASAQARRGGEAGEGSAAAVRSLIASLAERPAASIEGGQRLVEDLGLDSLGLSELVEGLEAMGYPLDVQGLAQGAQGLTVQQLTEALERGRGGAPRAQPPRRPASSNPGASEPGAPAQAELSLPAPLIGAGRALLRRAQRLVYEDLYDVRVSGREHVPPQGQLLVVANHCSHLDMGLIKHALGARGERLVALAARDYFFNTPLKRAYFENFTQLLPMEREGVVRESLRVAQAAVEAGHPLLIFPEGTRSVDGSLQPFHLSAGFLALSMGVDVLPIYVDGSYEALPKGARWARRVPLRAAVGPRITQAAFEAATQGLPNRQRWRAATALLEDAVQALRDARPRRAPEAFRALEAEPGVEALPAPEASAPTAPAAPEASAPAAPEGPSQPAEPGKKQRRKAGGRPKVSLAPHGEGEP